MESGGINQSGIQKIVQSPEEEFQCHCMSHNNQMETRYGGPNTFARTQALWDICVMLFYCHLCGIMRHSCCWGWRGDAVSCKTARCIQKETARSQSVSPLITALYPLWFRLSKQRCRGHQDCRVIEPAWAALSSASAKNTSPLSPGTKWGKMIVPTVQAQDTRISHDLPFPNLPWQKKKKKKH